MPTLDTHAETTKNIKLLMLGDSGGGKTGALAALANAGYNLRILDFDQGAVDVLLTYVDRKYWSNIECIVLTDKIKAVGPRLTPDGKPTAFSDALALLTHWRYNEDEGKVITKRATEYSVDFDPLDAWTANDILVIDSLSFMSEAALRYVLHINGRSGEQPFQSDWGEAQRMIEGVLQLLNDTSIKCHVIVNTHITIVEPTVKDGDGKETALAGGIIKALPMALGKALPPKVGTYFNTMLRCRTRGTKRVIKTMPEDLMELKVPLKKPPRELSLETGLAEIFTEILKRGET